MTGGRCDAIGKEQTQELHRAMLAAAEPHLLRILGPDSLGIMAPRAGINASLGDVQPLAGSLALVAQSGAALTPVLEWASARGIGFSHVVSLGEMVDVDFGDMLDYLAGDPNTRAILLFIETLKPVRKFLSAARAATRTKPVIALKSGRFQDISWCSTSPLVDLAGTANLYEAIFWRAGIVQVSQLEDLFDAVQTLHTVRSVAGDRLAIVTNGGGIGWLAADALCDAGGRMANLSPDSIERLTPLVPPGWSPGEPIDLGSNAQGCHYTDALEILLNDRGLDAVFALHSPNALSPSTETAQAVVAMVQKRAVRSNAPVVFTAWLGEASDSTARQLFAKHRIPSYDTPDRAVRGMMQMVRYRRLQETLMQTVPPLPDSFTPDTGKAREIIDQAITEGRAWLTGPETKGVLAAYGIPVVPAQAAATPEEAAAIAKALEQPVALKILSPDILQKSVAGGVLLSLENPLQVKEAAAAMLEDVGKKAPHARLLGFTIEPMMRLEASHELMLAMLQEAHVGPVILFGHGGTAFDLIQDGILGLPPLDLHLARQLIKRTRIGRLLEGASGMPAADMESIALMLVKISQLVCDLDAITELNINPLLAWAQGVVAVDAWMKVAGAARPAAERLAIRPYPKELEEAIKLADGHTILLRPIRPEDEPLYVELFAKPYPGGSFLAFSQSDENAFTQSGSASYPTRLRPGYGPGAHWTASLRGTGTLRWRTHYGRLGQ